MKEPTAKPHKSVKRALQPSGRRPGWFRSQSGQSLVEVALLTPLLLAMVLGATELGRYAYLSILVGNAARAGAAYGSQGPVQAGDTANIQAAALNDFQNNGQAPGTLIVSSNDGCGCDNGGTFTSLGTTTAACSTNNIDPTTACSAPAHWVITVSVTASATFHSLFSYPWIPSKITVVRTSTMRVKQ